MFCIIMLLCVIFYSNIRPDFYFELMFNTSVSVIQCEWSLCGRRRRRPLIVRWSRSPTCSCSSRIRKPTTTRNIRRWTTTNCGGSWWRNSTASVIATRSGRCLHYGSLVWFGGFPTGGISRRFFCRGIWTINRLENCQYIDILADLAEVLYSIVWLSCSVSVVLPSCLAYKGDNLPGIL